MNDSLKNSLASLPADARSALLAKFSDEELRSLVADWRFHARSDQIAPPGSWRIWMMLGGRGAGKTRAGAEWIREQVRAGKRRIAFVGPTAADVRDVMVEGPGGVLSCSSDADRPMYIASARRLVWPNGAHAQLYSAEEPERLRGPQFEAAWCDEVCAWERGRQQWAWDMLMFGLRLGTDPRCVVTTTPKPQPLLRSLIARHGADVVVTRASTYANAANLAPEFLKEILARYEGTRLGRQEINAELLEEAEGALWSRALLDSCRVASVPVEFRRVVVGVDPSATAGGDETGIVVAALGVDGRAYVLGDHSMRASPDAWASKVCAVYELYGADRVVAEANNGGEMVGQVIRTVLPSISLQLVHAQRAKSARAEPIAALYEQGRVSHVGALPALEDQMATWVVGDPSPDRLDAAVWALTSLMLKTAPIVRPVGIGKDESWTAMM